MTEWVDGLVAKLSSDQKQRNVANAMNLMHADIIGARAPKFMEELTASVETLAKELNEKLGASIGEVTFQGVPGYGFVVGCAATVASVSVSGKLNTKGHQIEVSLTKKGPLFVGGDGISRTFIFKIDGELNMYVQEQHQATAPKSIYRPDDLASSLLRDVFTADLLPAR
jgi:hypothetical protein